MSELDPAQRARAALKHGRQAWLADVAQATASVRERQAQRLEAAGRAHAKRRERERWEGKTPGLYPRDARGKPRALPERESEWHSVRATGKRELFQRVKTCADETKGVRLTCRGCSESVLVPIGCGSKMFCARCRVREVAKFRVDFERRRQGLTTAARRAGLMARYRKRAIGGRFGERLVTLTLPHVGSPVERLQRLSETWARFWRLLSERMRPELARIGSGIREFDETTGEVLYRTKRGRNGKRAVEAVGGSELSLWDLVSYLWVREWTPGDDGLGHPHLHVWLFSPFLEQAMLRDLWELACSDVTGWELTSEGLRVPYPTGERVQRLVLDVRAVWESEKKHGSVASELVKYLTKEWEIDDAGVRRARPEIFAQVYAHTDGRRQRQSCAGLASWAVKKYSVCPCCGHSSEMGSWARVAIEVRAEREAAERLAKCSARPPPFPESYGRGPTRAELSERLAVAYRLAQLSEWSDETMGPLRAAEAALQSWDESARRVLLDAERDEAWLAARSARW